jgi:hypothetical protein
MRQQQQQLFEIDDQHIEIDDQHIEIDDQHIEIDDQHKYDELWHIYRICVATGRLCLDEIRRFELQHNAGITWEYRAPDDEIAQHARNLLKLYKMGRIEVV